MAIAPDSWTASGALNSLFGAIYRHISLCCMIRHKICGMGPEGGSAAPATQGHDQALISGRQQALDNIRQARIEADDDPSAVAFHTTQNDPAAFSAEVRSILSLKA